MEAAGRFGLITGPKLSQHKSSIGFTFPNIAAEIRAACLEQIMRILRLPEVQAKTGLKHSAIYERIQDGTFPKPVPLGPKARGFVETEIDGWIKQRIAARDGEAA
jgi:prophage regulatory protein